jgi:hypothetical protein
MPGYTLHQVAHGIIAKVGVALRSRSLAVAKGLAKHVKAFALFDGK